MVYGAFAGGVVAATIFFIRHKLPVLKFADIVAPCLVLGLALGRVGCFLNGCCYGGLCDRPWAVTFPPRLAGLFASGQSRPISAGWHPFRSRSLCRRRGSIRRRKLGRSPGRSEIWRNDWSPSSSSHRAKKRLSIRPAKRFSFPSPGQSKLSAAFRSPTLTLEFRTVDAEGKPATHSSKLAAAPVTPARSLPVHPTQLYSALGALLLTLFLACLVSVPSTRRRSDRPHESPSTHSFAFLKNPSAPTSHSSAAPA